MIPKQVTIYLIENFHILKQCALASVLISFPISGFSQLSNWAVDNQTYVSIILWTIMVDWILGTIVHLWWKKDFSTLNNIAGLALKLLVVLMMGSVFEGLSHLTHQQAFIFTYLQMMTRILILFYPGRSAMLNCYILTQGKFPPKLLIERTLKFNETLDVDILIGKKSSGEDPTNQN